MIAWPSLTASRFEKYIQSCNVISRKALKEAAANYPDVAESLDAWYRIAKRKIWRNIQDVRRTYAHADAVGDCTVFNIKGNHYRLIVKIRYRSGRVFIRRVLTHAEYNKEGWKNECYAS